MPAALLIAIFSVVAFAQEKIVSETNLVTVNVIVTDKEGRYVKGLKQDQFEIYDEKVKQQITHFSTEQSPVSLSIVCEIHDKTPEKTRAMLNSLRQFTRGLGQDDDFFFTAFGAQGSVTSEFIPTAEQVFDHLRAVKPGGPTALYDAVYTAAEKLRKRHNLKKVLLIVSDGEDEKSQTTHKQLMNRLREFDVQIYAIGIANPAMAQFPGYGRWVFEDLTRQTGRRSFLMNSEAVMGKAVLAEMARVSGGATYFPENENEPDLIGICAQITHELRQQYTIGFYASNTPSKNDWHKIRVVLNPVFGDRREMSLSYRQGYRLGR
jgi:Ca-activated chloride channel family protein